MKKKTSILSGIIGAILGALLASIPWILVYIFGNLILSPLATLVAMGAWKGYELMKGKIIPSLPFVIGLISILTVVFIQMLIIPLCMMVQEGYGLDFSYLMYLYSFSSFFWSMIKDCAIGVIFAFLGISSVIRDIKNRIDTNTYESFEQPHDFR